MIKKELDKPGPATAWEVECWGLNLDRRPLTATRLQELYDHQRWLASKGKFGERLKIRQEGVGDRKNYVNYDLDGMDFSQAGFDHVSFVNCTMRGARFTGAHLGNVHFLGCDVEGADFRGAHFVNINSGDATFEETNYEKALFDPDVVWSRPFRSGILAHTPDRRSSPKI